MGNPIFDLVKFLSTWMSGVGLDHEAVKAKLAELAVQFPDLEQRTIEMAAWLEQALAPVHDVEGMKNTILGIAQDLVHGTSGQDPNAWSGSV